MTQTKPSALEEYIVVVTGPKKDRPMPRKPKLDPIISRYMSKISARRTTFAGGRPRSTAERCGCGVMTLKRAKARGRTYEHDPSCGFYPSEPRAIIV